MLQLIHYIIATHVRQIGDKTLQSSMHKDGRMRPNLTEESAVKRKEKNHPTSEAFKLGPLYAPRLVSTPKALPMVLSLVCTPKALLVDILCCV